MNETDITSADLLQNAIRSFLSFLDRPAYALLTLIYQLFFNVTSATIISSSVMVKFFGRVQLIIGVYMMFQLALTIMKGIVNPDSFNDAKTGWTNLVTRVAISLIMLTFLVPINIPSPQNEYEKQIKNNGLLFGTLYSLQYRILKNNTIGTFILGSSSSNYIYGSNDDELKLSSRIFSSTILKAFYRINLVPESERKSHADGKDDAVFNNNRVCKNIDSSVLKAYTRIDAEPSEIISMVNETCVVNLKKRYVFTYMPFISAIVGFIFAFIFLSFTVDIGVRMIKLAFLRLIAPIPIISYMDPKGSKDGSFNTWVKTLTSTYLDLFFRLITVYFVIFIIQNMISNGIVITHNTGMVGIASKIIIFIALFVFAKQAPKFIRDVLGIKGDGGKLFGGFGEILGAGAVVGSFASGAIAGATSHRGDGVGKAIIGGFAGGIGGGFNAGKLLLNSKDPSAKNIAAASRSYNDRLYANAKDASTFRGRIYNRALGSLGLKNEAQRYDDKIAAYNSATDAWKRVDAALNSDTVGTSFSGSSFTLSDGTSFTNGSQYTIKDVTDVLGRMKSSGMYSQSEIEQVEKVQKDLKTQRFDQIRTSTNPSSLVGVESQVYEAANTIYTVGKRYANDSDKVFTHFASATSVADSSLSMGGDFKGASYNADRQASAIKASSAYARAKANAKRAEEKK